VTGGEIGEVSTQSIERFIKGQVRSWSLSPVSVQKIEKLVVSKNVKNFTALNAVRKMFFDIKFLKLM
jgi:hypothetical protein